jgi:RND family efflux transporter MFP subunit
MKRFLTLFFIGVIVFHPALASASSFDATVHWARKTELSTPVSGIVDVVHVVPGARVANGQALVVLKQDPFQVKVDEAEAVVAHRRADLREVDRDHQQAKELYERQVLSTVELENAKLKLTRTQAELKRVKARLAQSKIDLVNSRIVAPFDALVLEVRVQPGQTVIHTQEASPMVILAARGEYAAHVRLSADAVTTLRLDQEASVTVSGNRYAGKIGSIGLQPSAEKSGEAKYEVRVLFTVSEAPWPAGVGARVGFP